MNSRSPGLVDQVDAPDLASHHVQHPLQGLLHDRRQVERGAGHGGDVIERRELSRPGSHSLFQHLLGLHLRGDVLNLGDQEQGFALHSSTNKATVLVLHGC